MFLFTLSSIREYLSNLALASTLLKNQSNLRPLWSVNIYVMLEHQRHSFQIGWSSFHWNNAQITFHFFEFLLNNFSQVCDLNVEIWHWEEPSMTKFKKAGRRRFLIFFAVQTHPQYINIYLEARSRPKQWRYIALFQAYGTIKKTSCWLNNLHRLLRVKQKISHKIYLDLKGTS